MSSHDPKPNTWAPPVVFVAVGFALGFFAQAVSAYNTVAGWIRPPPLPKVAEEYLMIEVRDGPIRESLKRISEQVEGLRFVIPKWLEESDAAAARMLDYFCSRNEFTMVSNFSSADDPDRQAMIADCHDTATSSLLIGTYALKSFDPAPISTLKVDFAVLTNQDGVVDAFDGFIDGGLTGTPPCLKSENSEDCLADLSSTETAADLPPIGLGETLILPIFFAYQFNWRVGPSDSPMSGNHATDGWAPTPLRFPARVMLGDRILIETPRPMHETASLRQGFYETRG